MRPDGRRTKKLIAAFHYYSADQAGWRCGPCRKAGLEKKRRCGWLPAEPAAQGIVWTRGGIALTTCPHSFITGQSLTWLEEYYAWKQFGGSHHATLPARQADAFRVLEQEAMTRRRHAEQRER